jgi:Ca2+-binding EF-hand superfamily protein
MKRAEEESVPEWERRNIISRNNNKMFHKCRSTNFSITLLERKLIHSITTLHKEAEGDIENNNSKIILTSRMLLPHYKLADLKNFLQIFQQVDEDYSGDLDVDEWVKFFTAFNKAINQQQARMIFNKADQNGDGFLSVSDLVPIIFNKTGKEQQQLILKFLEHELKKRRNIGNDSITESEIQTLFEHYDNELVGYLKVQTIREKVKGFNLTDAADFAITSLLIDYEDDEMFNFTDFKKIFQNYIIN